jgi:hypothetical protein
LLLPGVEGLPAATGAAAPATTATTEAVTAGTPIDGREAG